MIEAKNLTNEIIPIHNLDVVNAEIPASGTVNLTATNSTIEIQNDQQLKDLINLNQIVLVLQGHQLSEGESILILEELLAEIASTSTQNGAIDTGHCFGMKREKYAYFEGATFTNSSIAITDAAWLVSVAGSVKTTSGTAEIIGFNDGMNSAQIYLDTATDTIKSRATGIFQNQEFKIKIVYTTI